ncbi:MAG TPA: hypothetical protein DDZ89_11985 [Clostridiales bacterium]|nr:hypothetical protein [Clostridiales bacterium]
MSWTKVKNILIIALVILNIFLFVTMQKTGTKDSNEKAMIENTISILVSRGIEIDTNIPDIKGQAKLLHLGQTGFDKNKVLSTLLQMDPVDDRTQTQFESNGKKVVFLNRQFSHFYFVDQSEKTERIISVNQKKAVEDYCTDYLASLDVVWDDYIVTDFAVNEQATVAEIQIMQNYQGNIVYDNYIKAIVSETGFVYVETSDYLINGVESSESRLLNSRQVLLKFFTTGSVDSKIIRIDQGFKKSTFTDSEVSEEQAGLCWRIQTEDGLDYYVSLMNGQEVK